MLADSKFRGIEGNATMDFLEANPEYAYTSICTKIYGTHNKETASKLIWAFLLEGHPDSPLYRAPEETKRADIEKHYFEGVIEWDKYQEDMDQFFLYALPQSTYDFKVWREKYNELTAHVRTKKWGVDQKELTILYEKGEKIYLTLLKMQTLMQNESKSSIKGGGELSKRHARRKSIKDDQ